MSLTQERLKELVHYDPTLGLFWWKPRPEQTRHHKAWNTRYADKLAGTISNTGYVIINIGGSMWSAHRLAWLYMTGSVPMEGDIDHANTWKLDNAFDNLRAATRSQNTANSKKRKNNTTGFKGVSRTRNGDRFYAKIQNGKQEYLGVYDTAEEASQAYERRALEVFGDFARAA